MYDLTGHLSEDQEEVQIDPIHLIRRGVYDGWKDLELKVMAEELSLSLEGTLHSIISMKGRLLSHQLGACTKVLGEARSGALLADEVGLGKTIEAGLVISELRCRGQASKVLVLTPASLTSQWRDELRQVFAMDFMVADTEARKEARRNGGTIWDRDLVISSIDTAKQSSNRDKVQARDWDIVVVDEAHKLKERKTQNFRLVQGLRPKVLLLLTATPIQNRLMELYNQVSLIEPRLLGTLSSFRTNFFGDRKGINVRNPDELRKRLTRVMIRNRRRDSPGLDLVRRFGQTVSFELSDDERRLYDEVNSFIKEEYLAAVERKRSAKGYLMILYQRMLTSSSRAIAGSLRKRMERIEDELAGGLGKRGPGLGLRNELSSMVDLDYSVGAQGVLHQLDMDPEKEALLKAELTELRRLCRMADAIKGDTKAEQLRSLIRNLGDEKVLVFTEFRATQRHLVEILRSDGHTVTMFHGGMTPEEKDDAILQFKGGHKVLVSTESGGEGRNLQFCHILINYDLPWNPMRVEQRIGRLHRIGQEHNVKIINFSTQDTIEEHVLDLLERKIRLFEEVVGDLDLILGEVSDEGNFEAMIMRILTESDKGGVKDRFEEVGRRIDKVREQNERDQKEGVGKVVNEFDLSTGLDPQEALRDALEGQARVMELVDDYLRGNGAKVWRDGPLGLEGTAPRSVMVDTGLGERFRLSFDRPHINPDPDPDTTYVAHGDPFLWNIMAHCKGRGFTAIRGVPGLEDRGVATFHARTLVKGMRVHRYLKTVHVDLGTLNTVEDRFGDLGGAGQEDIEPPAWPTPERIEAAYSSALSVFDASGRELASRLAQENERLSDLDLERVNTFYDDLEEELSRKEKLLEDEKYELVHRIRAAKESRSRSRYKEDLRKVNRRFDNLVKKNSKLRDGHRQARLDEIRKVESGRSLKTSLELVAVGISLPMPRDGDH